MRLGLRVCLMASLMAAGALFGKVGKLESPDFSKIAPHPRILFTGEVRDRLMSEISSNPHAKDVHEFFIKQARSAIKKDPPDRKDEGFRMTNSGEELRRMFLWGYAWITTRDKSFPERARAEIEQLAKFEDWNPKHFLDTATMAAAFAVAYDWFYDAFDGGTKKLIASEIEKKGLLAIPKRAGWMYGKKVNNWSQVCSGGILWGALSIYEENPELCGRVILDMLGCIQKGTLDCFSAKGSYLEGLGYWNYGASFHARFLGALESAFGTDLGFYKAYPRFLESAKFIGHMVGPSGKTFNYSDSGEKPGKLPLMLYFARKTGDGSLMFSRYKDFPRRNFYKDVSCLEYFILSPGEIPPEKKPEQNFWIDADSDVPLFLGRTGWDDGALYLGVKGGKATSSHAHMDGGSFVFDALGERWIYDLGLQNYYSLEKLGMRIWDFRQNSDRWKVFRYNSLAHNIPAVDGSHINVDGFAKIVRAYSDKNAFGADLDLTELYTPKLKSATRKMRVVDSEKLEVRDILENGPERSKVRWNACTYDTSRVVNKREIEVVSPKGAKMLIRLVSPKNFEAKIVSAKSENAWDAENPGRAFAGFEGCLEPSQRAEIVVEMIPKEAAEFKQNGGNK